MTMNQRILFRDATLVSSEETRKTHVLVENGRILDTAADPHAACDQTVSCDGLHMLPGVIDDQVHFRQPGLEHKEDLAHASRACAAGGVTSFLEMPNTKPPAITMEGVHAKQRLASESSLVNYGFYIGATPDNLDQLVAAGSDPTIPGIKIFIGSSTGNLLVDSQEALEAIFAETTLRLTAHCEDETTVRHNAERYASSTDIATHSKIRDHEAAVIATKRAIDLSVRHQHPFHVLHVSTADEIPLIAAAPDHVTGEACVHHLWFTIDDYERLGSRIQMNPSIKTSEDVDALWQALRDGVLEVVATDHAPHTTEEKSKPYPQSPSGLPAVENSLSLMLESVHRGQCTLNQVVRWMCENPARVWMIDDRGILREGNHADLVLVDLDASREIRDQEQHTKCGWTPWHGERLRGRAVATYVAGREVWSLQKGFAAIDTATDRQLTFRSSAGETN